LSGSAFQILAAATGKARLPTEDRVPTQNDYDSVKLSKNQNVRMNILRLNLTITTPLGVSVSLGVFTPALPPHSLDEMSYNGFRQSLKKILFEQRDKSAV